MALARTRPAAALDLAVAVLAAGGILAGAGTAVARDAPGAESSGAADESGAEAASAGASRTEAATEASATASLGYGDPAKEPVRWHGSTLLFDQSASTQTIHVGSSYQSADPTYEWWLAFKPRYFLYERKSDAVSLNLWMNLYLEVTNSDTTTRSREPIIGPTYLWATWAHTVRDVRGYKTALTIGPRVTLPTDKAARSAGQILGLGASAGVSQTVPLRGRSARALKGARLGVNVIYNHPFSRATSGVNDDIHQLRQDVAGRTILSDQLSGSMNVQNALNLAFTGELQILRRLDLSLSYVLLNAWSYAPPAACIVTLTETCAVPMAVEDPTTYRVSTWATASLNYDVLDELSVAVGYYNLSSQIGLDGTRRNPLWSPAARVFLTVTANLDAIYERFVVRRSRQRI